MFLEKFWRVWVKPYSNFTCLSKIEFASSNRKVVWKFQVRQSSDYAYKMYCKISDQSDVMHLYYFCHFFCCRYLTVALSSCKYECVKEFYFWFTIYVIQSKSKSSNAGQRLLETKKTLFCCFFSSNRLFLPSFFIIQEGQHLIFGR